MPRARPSADAGPQHDEHCVLRAERPDACPGRIAEVTLDRFGERVAWIAHPGQSQFLFWRYVADLTMTPEERGEAQRARFRAAVARASSCR